MIKSENGETRIEGTVPTMCAELAVIIATIKAIAMEDVEAAGNDSDRADEISNKILTSTYFVGIQRGREYREKKRKESNEE